MNETEIKNKIRSAIKVISSLNSKITETTSKIETLSVANEELTRENFDLLNKVIEKKDELTNLRNRDKEIVSKFRTNIKNLGKILDNIRKIRF